MATKNSELDTDDLECIEPETESQRIEKAVRRLIGLRGRVTGETAFPQARILVTISPEAAASRTGQRMLLLILNQLLRFKSVVATVGVMFPSGTSGIPLFPGVPCSAQSLGEMAEGLAAALSGESSRYRIPIELNPRDATDYHVGLGIGAPDGRLPARSVWVAADGWTGYINAPALSPSPMADLPFGAYLAASLGVAEVFKHLLLLNYRSALTRSIRLAGETGLSAWDYSVGVGPRSIPTIGSAQYDVGNLIVAGAGAGGSAALYALASIPGICGTVDIVDPQKFGLSNLGRYLMTDYVAIASGAEKAPFAAQWVKRFQPGLRCLPHPFEFKEFARRHGGKLAPDMLLSTVDTAEIRREIQATTRSVIGDAAVADGLYTLLVVYYGQGRCLGCKHPFDADSLLKKSARRWGYPLETVQRWKEEHHHLTAEDLKRTAITQNVPLEVLLPYFENRDFANIWSLQECGAADFPLELPDQAPTLPFLTTAPGILLAAEVIKHTAFGAREHPDMNWWQHDMFNVPRVQDRRWRPFIDECATHCQEN